MTKPYLTQNSDQQQQQQQQDGRRVKLATDVTTNGFRGLPQPLEKNY
jgi:hypothetical protein